MAVGRGCTGLSEWANCQRRIDATHHDESLWLVSFPEQGRFAAEYCRILRGRELPSMIKRLYQLRRFVLMLVLGNVFYVLRGFGRRALGSKAPRTLPMSRNGRA